MIRSALSCTVRARQFVRSIHIHFPHKSGPKQVTAASQKALVDELIAKDRDPLPEPKFEMEFSGADGDHFVAPWRELLIYRRGGTHRVYRDDHWYTAERLQKHVDQLENLYRMRHSTVVSTHGRKRADQFVAENLDRVKHRYRAAVNAKFETRREALEEVIELEKELKLKMWDLDGILPDPDAKRPKMSKPEKFLTKADHLANKERIKALREKIANRPPPSD